MQGLVTLCAIFFASFTHAQEFCNDTVPVKGAPRGMPSRGYITCCHADIMKDVPRMVSTMKNYLKQGGRLIETAALYMLEPAVGQAVRESGVPRHEIWLVTKVNVAAWFTSDFGDPAAFILAEVDKSLQAMGVSYMDVMSLHFGPQQAELIFGTIISTEVWQGMWRGLIEAKRLGKILYTGVALATQLEIEHLMQIEPPAVAFIFLNPWMPVGQVAYANWLRDSGIAVIVWGLFNFKNLLPLPINAKLQAVMQLGEQHGVTYGQFLIQWCLQQGYAFATGFYHEKYVPEDGVCLNFNVTSNDKAILNEQRKWPCKFVEKCVRQYSPGCYPPEDGPHHHVWVQADLLQCILVFPQILSEELPRGLFHTFDQELILGVIVMSMLVATATVMWRFNKRGVSSEAGLSVLLLE